MQFLFILVALYLYRAFFYWFVLSTEDLDGRWLQKHYLVLSFDFVIYATNLHIIELSDVFLSFVLALCFLKRRYRALIVF